MTSDRWRPTAARLQRQQPWVAHTDLCRGNCRHIRGRPVCACSTPSAYLPHALAHFPNITCRSDRDLEVIAEGVTTIILRAAILARLSTHQPMSNTSGESLARLAEQHYAMPSSFIDEKKLGRLRIDKPATERLNGRCRMSILKL